MKTTENRQSNWGKTTKMKTEQNKDRNKKKELTVVTPHTKQDKILLRLVLKWTQDKGETHQKFDKNSRVISIRTRDKTIIDKKIKTKI